MASHLLLRLPAPPPLLLHFPQRRVTLPQSRVSPTAPLLGARLVFSPASAVRPARARGSSIGGAGEDDSDGEVDGAPRLVGEDSAAFRLGDQRVASWVYFGGILAVVLWGLNVLWIDPSTGVGTRFLEAVAAVSDNHEVTMLLLTIIFAVVHSGMASLRETGEKIIGERAYRIMFAGISLPLAVSTVVYFINHRYDGIQLWQVQGISGIHELVWLSSFISFFFLYPSTFNLLEVAAVDKPKFHMWETGIMRITRHPQVIWCLAHTLWIGNSVAVAASVGLIGHHLFGVWNGDRRLASRYGEAFEVLKKRTSVIPFAAVIDGRQKLPKDYYREFIRDRSRERSGKGKKKLISRRRLPEPLAASSRAPAGPPGAAASSERSPAGAAPPTPPPPHARPTLALPRCCRLLAAAGEPGLPSAGAFSTAAAASSRAASGDLGSPSASSSSRAPARELWWVTALRSIDSRLRHREATIQSRRDGMGSQLKGALAAATIGRT
uniref:NnrU domain-containing protein n=1 Tax=Oryza rufipogon TaxID=4529 RepID=A0A0E0RGA7_ORYRU